MVVVRGERWILAHRFRTVILTGACHTQLKKLCLYKNSNVGVYMIGN